MVLKLHSTFTIITTIYIAQFLIIDFLNINQVRAVLLTLTVLIIQVIAPVTCTSQSQPESLHSSSLSLSASISDSSPLLSPRIEVMCILNLASGLHQGTGKGERLAEESSGGVIGQEAAQP